MENLIETIERHGLKLIQIANDYNNGKISEIKMKETAFQLVVILKQAIIDSEKKTYTPGEE